MRGKNILWLSLIAMLLSVMMVSINPTTAAPATTLSLDQDRLPDKGLGHPGDQYILSVNIDNVENLWAVQFTIKFAPYVSVLVASEIYEANFMSEDGAHATYFTYTTDAFEGTFTVVIMRWGPAPRIGVSGSGTLATFKLTVVEAGESPIDIIDSILLDPEGNYIPTTTSGSYYYGPTARLIRTNLPEGRKITAGQTFPIQAKVKNDGDVPLNVTVRFDILREDGRKIVIRAGQSYSGGGLGEPLPFEYLYVDEFNEYYYEFNGDPTNLFGEPDGSYIEGDFDAGWASLYSFEDITLAGREIANIWVEGYTRYPNGATEGVDIDLYGFSSVSSFAWWGSCYGTSDWGWHGTRWIDGESVLQQQPELADETELNNVELLVYNYLGDAPDVIQIDGMRLTVEFASIVPVNPPIYEVQPGEELELDPVIWISDLDHVGSYDLTATIEYTSEDFHWNSWGSVQKTSFFWIVEP